MGCFRFIYPERQKVTITLRNTARWAFAILIFQIIYGGFVAGLNAGLIHNHWPLMSEGKFMHETVLIEQPTLFLNLVEGKSGVQFVHRTVAYLVVAMILFLFYKSRKFVLSSTQSKGINIAVVFVFIQFLLGVFTLLLQVPLWLGLAHQVMAFFLLTSMVYTLHRLSK